MVVGEAFRVQNCIILNTKHSWAPKVWAPLGKRVDVLVGGMAWVAGGHRYAQDGISWVLGTHRRPAQEGTRINAGICFRNLARRQIYINRRPAMDKKKTDAILAATIAMRCSNTIAVLQWLRHDPLQGPTSCPWHWNAAIALFPLAYCCFLMH